MYEKCIEDIKALRRQVAPEDIIMALFSQIEEENIVKDHSSIQKALYSLRENPEYNKLLKNFTFNTSGITPYSRLLEQVLNRLETFSIFGTLNPKYEFYKVNKKYLEEAFNKFDEKGKELISNMSKSFNELIH